MKRRNKKYHTKMFYTFVMITFVMQSLLVVTVSSQTISASETNKGFEYSTENRAQYMDFQHYKGQLHSHTSISDGIGMPEDAYDYVKQNTDLDFYAVTEHDVTFEISSGHDYIQDYQDAYSEGYKTLIEQSNVHNVDHEFVAIPGVEITWYDKIGGHINLFNTSWFPRTYGEGANENRGWGNLRYDLTTFYARLAQDPDAIAQYNHPGADRHGNFDNFGHYNEEVDRNISLYEYRYHANYPDIFEDYVLSLDKGWHLSPVYNGDEHNGNWGNVGPYVTGLWTEELTRESIFDALRNRRTYTSSDRNFELAFSANGYIMGSLLPAETAEIDIQIVLNDPDPQDLIDKVLIYTNQGQIIKEYTDINSNAIVIEDTLPSANGDYFFVRVYQTDGDDIISAPIWIGEVTRGTDFAPEITIDGTIPEVVTLNDTVTIPSATATDDSGETPQVQVTVFDAKGEVLVSENQFTVTEYGEYFVKYYATDSNGNRRVDLNRIVVDDQNLNAEKILNEFKPVVNVGQKNDEVGVNLVTDKVLREAYVQYKPVNTSWDAAEQVRANLFNFEIAYGDSFPESNYRILASHEATLKNLIEGTDYQYRYGLGPDGPWGESFNFTTATHSVGDTVMYVLGDLEETNNKPTDFNKFNEMFNVLKDKNPDGQLLVQLGNLVDNASHIEPWEQVNEHILDELDIITAHVAGKIERYTAKNRFETLKGFFNLPQNSEGSSNEPNYSFDYGDVHVAVLNTMGDLDEQLAWLEQDMRTTEKKWRVVMGHYPYYGGEYSDYKGRDMHRAKLTKKFKELGVILYIGGQDHIYKRTTIRDGVKINDINMGTTFITAGTTGSTFYPNKEFDWDHIVYDDEKQSGIILQSNDSGLTVKAYNIDGNEIDSFTIQPESTDISRFVVENNAFQGVGLLNYAEDLQSVVVVGEKLDYYVETVLETQIKEVPLTRLGHEQLIMFDEQLSFEDEHTITVAVYDNMTDKNLLIPTMIVKEGMIGDGSPSNPFRIKSADGLSLMNEFPDGYFVLEKNIEGNANLFSAIGAGDTPFTGVFDGQGHTISGLLEASRGAGLFAKNEGVIKNIGIIDTHINSSQSKVGILVDENNGTVENAYSTGSIIGNETVGGLVGLSNGVVLNSYSTADVTSNKRQAGGVIGITAAGSLTENVYASGAVSSPDGNVGGISGYGYNQTIVRNAIALNPSVSSPQVTNRVVARVLSGHVATLGNNYARADMDVEGTGDSIKSLTSLQGKSLSPSEVKDPSTYNNLLGWDFSSVWIWDEQEQRPILQVFTEDNGSGQPLPGSMRITRYLIEDYVFQGVRLLNYYDDLDSVVVIGEKRDADGETVLETQVKEATLTHVGLEHSILFDEPFTFAGEDTITVKVYDNMIDQNLLIPLTIVREGMVGDGSPSNPFRIKNIEDLNKVNQNPDKHFILDRDIVGMEDQFTAIGSGGTPFTGTFDGNGHTISGLIISSPGAGLFSVNEGVIKNIGMIDTHIDTTRNNVGILVDRNNGTVENAYSTGSIIGNETVGGLIGFSTGTVRNSYSTADVTSIKRQAGGVIGITAAGSLTENVYATGVVNSPDSNVGGISAYGYDDTIVRNVIALNSSVTSPDVTNRVLGRVRAGHTATLENNYAWADMHVEGTGDSIESPTSLQGEGLTLEEIEDPDTYTDLLSWDFATVWAWDEQELRPVLQVFVEKVIDLKANNDQLNLNIGQSHSLTMTAYMQDETELDVTTDSIYSSNDEQIATVSEIGVVKGHAAGATEIIIEYEGLSVTIPVTVSTNNYVHLPIDIPDEEDHSDENKSLEADEGEPSKFEFVDLEEHWANEEIMKLVERGILNGYLDNTFKPDQTMTRAEVSALFSRVFDLDQSEQLTHPFVDVDSTHWANAEIARVYHRDIMFGMSENIFAPEYEMTREQFVTMLMRALKMDAGKAELSFIDETIISDWAIEAVRSLVSQDLIQGYPDGTFRPQQPMTRAEVATLISRLQDRNTA